MSDSVEIPDELVIEVRPPVVYAKGEYPELRLREPRTIDVRKAEGQTRSGANLETMRLYYIHLVANVSGWPIPAVELLPIRKLNQAVEYLAGFINASPRTGES